MNVSAQSAKIYVNWSENLLSLSVILEITWLQQPYEATGNVSHLKMKMVHFIVVSRKRGKYGQAIQLNLRCSFCCKIFLDK